MKYSDGATFEERFNFSISGRKLSGTASMRGYGYRRAILDGTVDGDRLSFRTTGTVAWEFGPRDVTFVYRGTLGREGIRFTVEDEGTGDPPAEFVATRISAEQANRIATGGTNPRLQFIDGNKLYSTAHIRSLVTAQQSEIDACYKAAEFDEVKHEHVQFELTLSAGGAVEQFAMRPTVASLQPCMQPVLTAIEWGPTMTGTGGTVRFSISARLPWNP